MTVGDAVPQAGQNAAPVGISRRHEGHVSWVVTARKICVRRPPCPGYGGSGGRATEASIYEAADAAYAAVARRPEVDRARIYVYGRSLGSAVASHVAAGHDVAGLVLESPFTNALDIAREHYALFPRFIVRLRLDNLANLRLVRCPVLVFHGTVDRPAPLAMGRRVVAAAPGPAELALIQGAGHNDTYDLGGEAYRRRPWQFVLGGAAVR